MLKRFTSKHLEASEIIKCSETNNFMCGCVQAMTNEIYMYDLLMPDLFTIHELTIHVFYSVRKLFTGFAIAALMD